MNSSHQNILLNFQHRTCTKPFCFFCIMKEPDSSLRRAKLSQVFQDMPTRDDKEHVLVLSGLWNIATAHPNDSEFPSLGLFECLAKLIHRGVTDKHWLLRDQNIYIPYYAAHIIGSYSMNKSELAEKALNSGVVPPLMELMRGKLSWVEQRVAVRALGHLAGHDRTFEAIADEHEVEVIELAMDIALNCLKTVYKGFVGVKDSKRMKYQCDVLTRGLGGFDVENRKAEEWASQLQCWSLHILNCFVRKKRGLNVMCKRHFLKELCGIWGGLVNPTSPGGIGLIRNICKCKTGRESVANLSEVIASLCNMSRSSDDWQYMAIDCLLFLLKDTKTRHKVMDMAASYLVDLVEVKEVGNRREVGEAITRALLLDYHKIKYGDLSLMNKKLEEALKETWELKVERRKKEKLMSDEELKDREVMVRKLKQEGNKKFWSGQIEKAAMKYTEALELCPLNLRKERIVLYSNRAQSQLLLRNPEAAISDTTRALCLSSCSPHRKSLWRRAQAYDMKGLARESLSDCLMFMNLRLVKSSSYDQNKNVKIPYYAARMFNKQMNATWLFAAVAKSNYRHHGDKAQGSDGPELFCYKKGMRTILEESSNDEKKRMKGKQTRVKGRRKVAGSSLLS